jgi:hypothetical protein
MLKYVEAFSIVIGGLILIWFVAYEIIFGFSSLRAAYKILRRLWRGYRTGRVLYAQYQAKQNVTGLFDAAREAMDEAAGLKSKFRLGSWERW